MVVLFNIMVESSFPCIKGLQYNVGTSNNIDYCALFVVIAWCCNLNSCLCMCETSFILRSNCVCFSHEKSGHLILSFLRPKLTPRCLGICYLPLES